MTRLLALAAPAQGALLIALLLLLVMPAEIPDPLRVGETLSWTVLGFAAGVPILLLAAGRRMPATRLDPFLWLYVACCLAVLPFSQDRVTSSIWLLSLAANLTLFYGVVLAARWSESFPAILLIAVVVGIAALQAIAFEFHLERGLNELFSAYDRPPGWSGYPELGLLACIQIAILIAMFQALPRLGQRLALTVVISVAVIELALLYSRLAWGTAAVLFVAAPLVRRQTALRRRWVFGAAVVFVLATALLAQAPVGQTLRQRFTQPSTVTGRLDIWSRTAQMVADHPLTGVGLGSFQAVYEPVYNPGLNSDLRRGGHAHNLWLQVAAEQGVVTALAYVALWIAVVSAAWRQRLGSWVQLAALLVVVAIAVRSLGDYMFFFTGGAPARLHTLMWLTWGIVCAEPSSVVKAR